MPNEINQIRTRITWVGWLFLLLFGGLVLFFVGLTYAVYFRLGVSPG